MKAVIIGFIALGLLALMIGCTEQTASEIDCKELAEHWKGKGMKNMFGMETKILKISNPTLVSRSETELECRGNALMDNGGESAVTMSYFQDSDGEWWSKISADD